LVGSWTCTTDSVRIRPTGRLFVAGISGRIVRTNGQLLVGYASKDVSGLSPLLLALALVSGMAVAVSMYTTAGMFGRPANPERR